MAQEVTATRDRLLDGIRGYAIVLVLLSHTWIIAPANDWTAVSWLFSSGDYAVTIFFVVSGFLATSAMLREQDRTGRIRPAVTWLRRWIRISAHVYPLVILVLALTAANWNLMVAYQGTDTSESAWRILTYTWNGYVRENAFAARPDLGHLWYVCTDLWVIGLILLVVFLVGRWRPVLIASLAATLLVVMLYRQHVYETEGVFSALIRVQTRADGLLWGALAAVVLPYARRLQPYAVPALIASTVLLVPLMGAVVDEAGYFGLGGWLLNIDMFVFVLAVTHGPHAGLPHADGRLGTAGHRWPLLAGALHLALPAVLVPLQERDRVELAGPHRDGLPADPGHRRPRPAAHRAADAAVAALGEVARPRRRHRSCPGQGRPAGADEARERISAARHGGTANTGAAPDPEREESGV